MNLFLSREEDRKNEQGQQVICQVASRLAGSLSHLLYAESRGGSAQPGNPNCYSDALRKLYFD